ncbi:MAG TPA: FtsX-like permease family protein, partial [Micromonosporaceae bacterium]
MFRLGLQLTLRSGREALVRLMITAAAVAVGVALLFGVLAEFHAFQTNANKQCWSCTLGASVPKTLPTHGELWNNSVDFYQGSTINRLDVAALGSDAPVPPGVTQLPPPGDYYASPALAALLRTVPADELGARFPGRMIGTIGHAGLNGADDLAIYIGHTPDQLNAIAGTAWVTSINGSPGREVWTPFFRYAFGVGVLAVVFPMLVLIATATRLAADRREERFAAIRLVGGTPTDIRIVAAIEAMISAFVGAVLGTVIFLLIRPVLAGAALVGTRYFEKDLTPTAIGYFAMLVGVPV